MTIKEESQFSKLLVPVKKVSFRKGFFRWPVQFVLASPNTVDILPLEQLASDLKKQSVRTRIDRNAFGPASLRVYRDNKITNDEAYQIIILADGVEIFAKADAGAYYAVQTLRDLVSIYGKVLPACIIEDWPDFRRRGVYHDCSRGKVPKLETLKELVKWLAHWKINELQLYVENVFTFKQHPGIGKGFSPFTPEEILSLQDYCKLHHIRLVGSLASFGHFEKILSLPKYSHLGEMPGFRGFLGGTTLCPIDSSSIKLVSELYREFIPLFQSEDFNVCCDETWELGKGRSKKRAEHIGTGGVYLEFLLKIYRLCEKYGKRMNAWADIVLKYPDLIGKLPRDMVLLNWEYEKDGTHIKRTGEIARAEIPLMVCPGTSSWLTHCSRMSNSMANVRNFAIEGRKYHADGLLNTDWGDQGHRNFLGASLHGFAHGAAHSWNSKAVDEEKFTENFCFYVFGQKTNHLSKTLKFLGDIYMICSKPYPNQSLLYHSLVEPLVPRKRQGLSAIDLMNPEGLRKILNRLSDEKLWPDITQSMGEFEKLAIREMKLAARMDYLASRRALIAMNLRSGKNVKSFELLDLSRLMHQTSKEFEELWLMRNKTSRLYDNLRLFRSAERELKFLAAKR